MVVYAFSSRTWEAEVGGSWWVQNSSSLQLKCTCGKVTKMPPSRIWVINYLYYIQAIQDSHWYKTWTTRLWKVDETLWRYLREASQLEMLDGATNTFLEKSPTENERICSYQVLTKERRWEGNVQMNFRTTKLFLMTINKFKSVECTKRILFLFLFFSPFFGNDCRGTRRCEPVPPCLKASEFQLIVSL